MPQTDFVENKTIGSGLSVKKSLDFVKKLLDFLG
jgi:hypothetical protein